MTDRYGSISIGGEFSSKKKKKAVTRHPSSVKKPKRGNNRGIFWAIVAAFFLGSYFMAALYLAPVALKRYLPTYLEKATGLSFTLKEIELNPFNFQLNFQNIRADIPKASTDKPLLEIPSLFIDMDLTSLLRNSFVCDKLTIKGLLLNITRFPDKHYNLPVLTQFTRKQDKEQIIDFTNLPFLFSFNNIDISDSHILLNDKATGKTHKVEQLHLAIPTLSNFSFQLKEYILPHFSAYINGSFVQLNGKKVPLADGSNFTTKLFCSVKDLELSSYLSYLPDNFPLFLEKGTADLDLELGFSPEKEQGERVNIDIKMAAKDLLLNTKKQRNTIILPSVKLAALFSPTNNHLRIQSIHAEKPQLLTSSDQLPRGLANFLADGASAKKRLKLFIDHLLLEKGRLVLTDQENATWNAIQLSIDNFDRGKAQGAFLLSAKQASGTGVFSWSGKLEKPGTLKGELNFDHIPAKTIFSHFSPFPKTGGSIEGNAQFTGDLSLHKVNKTSTLYDLDKGTLLFHKLKFSENNHLWFAADTVQFSNLKREKDHFDLGNMSLKQANLDLTQTSPPSFISSILFTKKRPSIQDVDFYGNISFIPPIEPKQPVQCQDVHFQINSTHKKKKSYDFVFATNFQDKGSIRSSGSLELSPLAIASNLAFSDIHSSLFTPYFKHWPFAQHLEASLNGKGTFTFPHPLFQGELRFNDGLLQLQASQPILRWDVLETDSIDCSFAPFALHSPHISITNPVLTYAMDSKSPFMALSKTLQTLLSTKQKDTDFLETQINKLSFSGATIELTDTRLSPQWKTKATGVKGYLNNINSREQEISSFDVEGELAGAKGKLSGALSLFDEEKQDRARLSLTNIPLNAFTEQLKQTDLQIANATATIQAKYKSNEATTTNSAEITIHDLSAIKAGSDTALALALLKDDSASFSLTIQRKDLQRSLVQEAISNLQTTTIKASYAPLLLDRNFNDLQDNNLIIFQPGTNTLSVKGKELLIRYAELLNVHPELCLLLTGLADTTIDIPTLPADQGVKPKAPPKEAALIRLAKERSLITYDFFIHSLAIDKNRLLLNDSPLIRKQSPAHGCELQLTTLPAKR